MAGKRKKPLPAATAEQQKLATDNLSFVYWVVTEFIKEVSAARGHRAELESAGAVGLLEACIRLDLQQGALTTFAQRYVMGAVRKEWRELSENIRRPRQGAGGRKGLASPLKRDPDMKALHALPTSSNVEAMLDGAALQARAIQELARRMNPTGDRERNARIFLEALQDDTLTNDALALRHGVSRERVRQIRARVGDVFQEWSGSIRAEA